MASNEKSEHASRSTRATRTIEIKLEVPQFKTVEKVSATSATLARKAWRKRYMRIVMAIMLVAIAAALTVLLLNQKRPAGVTGTKLTTTSEADQRAQVPQFDTLLPASKTIESLGGWTRVSPPDRNAVFAYSDGIRDNRIIISQQPLPDTFFEDTEGQMEALAQSYKATEKLTVNNLIVYIGTSAKGPQSVIFTKSGLLVLIKSSVKLSNDDWVGYVSSLQ